MSVAKKKIVKRPAELPKVTDPVKDIIGVGAQAPAVEIPVGVSSEDALEEAAIQMLAEDAEEASTPPTPPTLVGGKPVPVRRVAPDDPGQAWISEEGVLYLSKYDLLQIEHQRGQIDKKRSQSVVTSLTADKTEYSMNSKIAAMRQQAEILRREANVLEEQYQVFLKRLDEKYGVDFSHQQYGYDDISGKITRLLPD